MVGEGEQRSLGALEVVLSAASWLGRVGLGRMEDSDGTGGEGRQCTIHWQQNNNKGTLFGNTEPSNEKGTKIFIHIRVSKLLKEVGRACVVAFVRVYV